MAVLLLVCCADLFGCISDEGENVVAVSRKPVSVLFMGLLMTAVCVAIGDGPPKMLAYSAGPTAYFDDHAAEVAELYDGLFFNIGSWDSGVVRCLGLPDRAVEDASWREQVKANVAHLREAGATESLLAFCFGQEEPWPSPETLLDPEFTAKLAQHFGAIGEAAKELGFRGVSIDVEYPYKRYALDHPLYTYDGYTADDLLSAAAKQGRVCMEALLDAFPDAVVFLLPGELRGRPIEEAYTMGLFDVMAARDATGGMHLGYERSYCLLDPASQVAIARVGDCAAEAMLTGDALDYWRRRCTVAPGVWPLHMVETGGANYPVRPWVEELAELNQQMATLRAVANRYIWSFTGTPVWLPASAELRQQYGLPVPNFENADAAITGWHHILKSKEAIEDARIKDLIGAIAAFDAGELDAAGLCARFGIPGDWMVLGYLSNPFVSPAFAAPEAATAPVDPWQSIQGRDGVVHWFPFHNYEPTGAVQLRTAFDYRRTDDCSVYLVTTVTADHDVDGFIWANFDDGGSVRLDDDVVLDHLSYPEKGHGILYRDRYLFEYHAPISITNGTHRLTITSVNAHGSWGLNFRIGDADGFPLSGLTFSLPEPGE